jgi:hypothetical protein
MCFIGISIFSSFYSVFPYSTCRIGIDLFTLIEEIQAKQNMILNGQNSWLRQKCYIKATTTVHVRLCTSHVCCVCYVSFATDKLLASRSYMQIKIKKVVKRNICQMVNHFNYTLCYSRTSTGLA